MADFESSELSLSARIEVGNELTVKRWVLDW